MRQPRSVYRRRQATALGGLLALVVLAVVAIGGGGGGGDDGGAADKAAANEKPAELPRGGRRIFPDYRVVAFYGAPQDDELGVLGIGSPREAARRLERQARPYARKTRPVLPAMELIAVIAANAPGEDNLWRTRQDPRTIDRYLRAARRAKALLVLDIQPGHSDFLVEARALERWLREPDVGLALDPEWHTPGVKPGTVIGSATSQQVNAVSAWLANIVREENLPEKLFVVHQFTSDMIQDKERVKPRPGLAITFNVDGFGDRPNKISKYRDFVAEAPQAHHGFKLFYKEDVNLMTPGATLDLRPPPDLVVYE
ncbi:MAG TPA: hypothetical protein VHF89_11380 [Solirubrobacteraceae bacterium]|nr:hypothetical protein [Solirubrobacteraceae bacterium]